jgi:hypothetical protein
VYTPNTTYILWDRKCGSSDNGAGGFVGHQLQDHQTPGHNLSPLALVLALGDPVVPIVLGVVLLQVQNCRRDVGGDVVSDIIAQDERYGLSFVDLNGGHDALAEHAWFLHLLEDNAGARPGHVLVTVNADIQLQLNVLGVKSHRLAVLCSQVTGLLKHRCLVRLGGVSKSWEDFHLYDTSH